MIKNYEIFINEEFHLGKKADELFDKMIQKTKSVIRYPVMKYIEKRIENVNDIKKLNIMAEVANKIDRGFSPMNNLKIGVFLFGILSMLQIFKIVEVNYIEVYISFIIFTIYTKTSKEYRLLAKEYYRKIKNEYIKKYLKYNMDDNHIQIIDPYGEDEWYPYDAYINYADEKRYRKRYKPTENMPFFGLRSEKDIEP